jgi:hypothetical protein
MDVEANLDKLYGLPLAGFTRARDDLARELRKAGEDEAADRVKALSKPSVSAWTVNQLARAERMQVRSLMTAGERLRAAQAELLQGGSAGELQDALQRQREVVAVLVQSAKEVLGSAGHPATDATLERIRGTLTAVAGDEEAARLVETGRLTKDLDPTGFGGAALGAGAAAKPRRRSSRRDDGAARKKEIEKAKQEADRLQAEVTEQRERARRAKSEARSAERTATSAKKAAEKEEQELESLTERLDAAKEALARARSG